MPISVAIGDTGLSPLQQWQLAQALANTFLPRASAVTPSLCELGVLVPFRNNSTVRLFCPTGQVFIGAWSVMRR